MRSSNSLTLAFLATVTLLCPTGVDAFWRMECRGRSGLARIDPLLNPGTVSPHVHAIHGGSGFSESSTTADLLASDCTSCSVAEDKSAYWHPALYFRDTSGKFTAVEQDGGMLAYYLLYPNSAGDTKIYPFPTDFQMIAGNTNQRNFSDYAVPDIAKSEWTGEYASQNFLEQAAVGFNCLNYDLPAEASLYRHFLPDKAYLDANCADGVRFELMFPSCWNGETSSKNQKSHVAYPSQVMTGECPSSHPKRLVSLFYEIIWRTEDFIGKDGTFVIANGDPTGYGFHGDFIMGWEDDVLADAVKTCTNESGQISDCPVFTIQDASVYNTCKIKLPEALSSENVKGPVPSLPGNSPIESGPAPAHGESEGAVTTSSESASASVPIVPTLSHSDGTTLAASETYIPGAVFAEASASVSADINVGIAAVPSSSAAVSTVAAPATTPAPAPVDTQSYFKTEYSTSGLTVNEVLWVEELKTVTVPTTSTATAFEKHKRHLHKHRRGL